jgi:MtN3 and saliva related transmembrane protein
MCGEVCEGRMTNEGWSVLLGTAAGFCTTISFVPQIIKIWKQGGRDVSYGMLTLFLVGVLLWFGYGMVVRARAVIITNLATAVLITIAMGMKAYTAKRDFGKTVMGDVGVGN